MHYITKLWFHSVDMHLISSKQLFKRSQIFTMKSVYEWVNYNTSMGSNEPWGPMKLRTSCKVASDYSLEGTIKYHILVSSSLWRRRRGQVWGKHNSSFFFFFLSLVSKGSYFLYFESGHLFLRNSSENMTIHLTRSNFQIINFHHLLCWNVTWAKRYSVSYFSDMLRDLIIFKKDINSY